MKLELSDEDKAFIKRYENSIGVCELIDHIKYSRLIRTQIYYDNKNAGLPDPLDVFDGYEGPILKKEDE